MSEAFLPDIIILYCGNSLSQGDYLPEGTIKDSAFQARFIMIPCGHKIEVAYFMKLIESGTDGVVLVICPKDKCRSLTGSARIKNRVMYARHLIEDVGVHGDRISIVEGHSLSSNEIKAIAVERADIIRGIGANALKAFGV